MTDEQVDTVVKSLTDTEKKFADDVLHAIWERGPEIAKVLKTLTGEGMKFEKNYFPLWFDFELSNKAAERQQETDLMKQLYSKLSVERGFTIRRVGGTEAPYLSFDVVLKHLMKVNHFLANAEAVRDVQKIVFDRDVRRAIEGNAGSGEYGEIVEWLKEWANPRRGYGDQIDRWFGVLRNNATLATLGLRTSVALLQPTAYLQAVNRIGLKNSMVGLADFYRSPIANTQFIYDLSPFMKVRAHSFDRDLKDFLESDPFYSKKESMKEVAMAAISVMDLSATLPTWWSAYHLALKEFKWDQGKSVEYADRIVRTTQASGMPKDLAGVLRGGNMKRSLNMFYTYFSSTYNEAMRDVRAWRAGEENVYDVMRSFMWLFAFPAAIQVLMRRREETTAGGYAIELVGNITGTIPYIGPVANAILSGYEYKASPVFELPKEVVMAAKVKEFDSKLKHAFMAFGYATGFPSRQAILTAQYIADVLEDKSYDPMNLVYREKKKKKVWK